MSFHRYASFQVLASGIADAQGSLPAEVTRVGGTGTAFVKNAHRHEFDYDPKPGYLYVRSRAISSRTNDNFDTFPAHAIKAAWRTFIGKPVFVNHVNANHRRSRGVIIDAALHEDVAPDGSPDTWTEVLMEVDAIRFPKLAEAVVKGHIDRTSMGTEVALSTCSFCGNQAANPTEYCRHIPAMKGQRITRTTASGEKVAVLVSEICEGLHFFENSLLVEAPADPTAYTFGLDTRGLAAEKATAHLVRTTSSGKTAALAAVIAEDESAPETRTAGLDFTDFEIFEAEALLAQANIMCSKCNPSISGETNQLCAGHAYAARQRADHGYSFEDFGTHMAAIDGTGPCGGHGCSCKSYTFDKKVGVYPTCTCGHSQNVHSGGEQKGGGVDTTQPQKASKTALGEVTAPTKVDTLRVEACPVCGEQDTFDGSQCRNCQFVQPPALFGDPDVNKAREVDLRGGDVDKADEAKQELQCNSCGATFPAPTPAKAVTNDKAAPAISATSAFPPKKQTSPQEPDKPQSSTTNDAPSGKDSTPPEGEDQQDQDVELVAGDTCPTCEVGTLDEITAPAPGPQGAPADQDQPVDPAGNSPQPGEQKDPAALDPAAVDPNDPNAPALPKVDPNAVVDPDVVPDPARDAQHDPGTPGTVPVKPPAGAAAPDHGQPVRPDPAHNDAAQPPVSDQQHSPPQQAEEHPDHEDPAKKDADPEGDDEDDDKKSPPWLKKKKAVSHRADAKSKEIVDMSNPAQENRNRLLDAMASQKRETDALKTAVFALASALGVGGHPHFASLVTAADDSSKIPEADRKALEPAAKDSPENIGAAPSSANTGVTPAATTDVDNTNVAVPTDPLGNLVDVTAPGGPGIEVPKGADAHVEHRVEVGTPDQTPFPNNSGWKQSAAEDPQVRFMASLRLAEKRQDLGMDSSVERVVLAQSINDDTTLALATIQHEIDTLVSVAGLRAAPAQQVAASRHLVPQRADVPRVVPSLQATAGVQPNSTEGSGIAASQTRDSFI